MRNVNNTSLTPLESEMLRVLQDAHDAIDTLFAMLVVRSPKDNTFHPSKSGAPWAALLVVNAAIAKAKGK